MNTLNGLCPASDVDAIEGLSKDLARRSREANRRSRHQHQLDRLFLGLTVLSGIAAAAGGKANHHIAVAMGATIVLLTVSRLALNFSAAAARNTERSRRYAALAGELADDPKRHDKIRANALLVEVNMQ